MKRLKVMALIIAVVFAIAVSGCSENTNAGGSDGISVVATIFAPYDFAREITGGKADVSMLLPPASESHSFEPTPQDIIRIQNCDVFIYVGGESDAWVDSILSSIDTSGIEIVQLMDCVEVVEEEFVEGMETTHEHEHDDHETHDDHSHDDSHDHETHDDHDHDHDHDHDESGNGRTPEYDEHVWTSPKNAMLIVQKISAAICAIDDITAENSDYFKSNTADYLEKLEKLDREFQNVVDNAVRKTIIFGDRFPFRYFVDAYGLDYYAAFPGCSAESEASSKTITFLINKVKDENIPVIYHAELSNKKIAGIISEDTGAKVAELHACHNISKDDFAGGVSYLDLMTANVDALKEGLS